jgi:squalene-hopene/tetraprenyl-beta-curcumene cyclase
MAAGDSESSVVQRGVSWLLDAQKHDGTWDEESATGTGFPDVFYLRYDMYRNYFPTLALAAFHQHALNDRGKSKVMVL